MMASLTIDINFDDELYSKFEKDYSTGNFSGAIKTSILYLTECIRERSDLDLDGDNLITKVFSLNSPLIKFNNLSTTSEKDEQLGHMMILQGIYKGIRNPRNHNLKSDDKFTCESILILIDYCVKKIKKAKLYFDYNEFLTIINDKYFDKSIEYSDEIIKMIPVNKLFDTNIALIENVNQYNYKNISHIIISSIKILDKNELNKFYENCSKILQKTDNYVIIKSLIFALRDVWNEIKKIARIRIEGLLIKSLENMEITEFRTNDEYNNSYMEYVNEDGLLSIYIRFIPLPFTKIIPLNGIISLLKNKLELGGFYVDFILTYFHEFIFKNGEQLYSYFNDVVIKLLKDGNYTLYNYLTSGSVINEEFYPNYYYDDLVKAEIERFGKFDDKAEKKDDDIPF